MEICECTPWQCCPTYGLDLPTSSTITGVRGAAGGRQPAAPARRCEFRLVYNIILVLILLQLLLLLSPPNLVGGSSGFECPNARQKTTYTGCYC